MVIVSKELLENALNNYTGTVLYVSHDRYFINQTATRILELAGKQFFNYIGNYDYYLDKKDTLHAAANYNEEDTASSSGANTVSENKLSWQQQKEQQAQVRKIENEIKKCETSISKLEARNEEIDALLVMEEIYTNVEELVKLNNEKKEIETQLEELMERWEELSCEL